MAKARHSWLLVRKRWCVLERHLHGTGRLGRLGGSLPARVDRPDKIWKFRLSQAEFEPTPTQFSRG
jgi:hypothetical protein